MVYSSSLSLNQDKEKEQNPSRFWDDEWMEWNGQVYSGIISLIIKQLLNVSITEHTNLMMSETRKLLPYFTVLPETSKSVRIDYLFQNAWNTSPERIYEKKAVVHHIFIELESKTQKAITVTLYKEKYKNRVIIDYMYPISSIPKWFQYSVKYKTCLERRSKSLKNC